MPINHSRNSKTKLDDSNKSNNIKPNSSHTKSSISKNNKDIS